MPVFQFGFTVTKHETGDIIVRVEAATEEEALAIAEKHTRNATFNAIKADDLNIKSYDIDWEDQGFDFEHESDEDYNRQRDGKFDYNADMDLTVVHAIRPPISKGYESVFSQCMKKLNAVRSSANAEEVTCPKCKAKESAP